MALENMPQAFQQAFQQNMLDRKFKQGLEARNIFRKAAVKDPIPRRIGESLIYSRAGHLVPVITADNPANNTLATDLNAAGTGVGTSNNSYPLEQFPIYINSRHQSLQINAIQNEETLASLYVQNWLEISRQAALSIDLTALQRLALAYESGMTFVTAATSASTTAHVDNINGLSTAFSTVTINGQTFPSGQPSAVSVSNPLTATVYPASGAAPYTITIEGASADGSNSSQMVTPGGVVAGNSGTLTFSAAQTFAVGDVIKAADAPTILRPNGKMSRNALAATDTVTIQLIINAVAELRRNNVDSLEDGTYLCALDPYLQAQFFADPDFKLAMMGQMEDSKIFHNARLARNLGVTFVDTTNCPNYAFTNSQSASLVAHHAYVMGKGALIEGTFDGMVEGYKSMANQAISAVRVVDDYALVTRPPLDSLSQIWTQSWVWIGGHVCPTDATVTPAVVPSATAARYKRCVAIEVAASS